MGAAEMAWLDRNGVIVAVNEAWTAFQQANDGPDATCGVGASYLAVCDAADDMVSQAMAAAVRAAGRGELVVPLIVQLPCDSPTAARWFRVAVFPRADDAGRPLGSTVTLSPVPGAQAAGAARPGPADLSEADGLGELTERSGAILLDPDCITTFDGAMAVLAQAQGFGPALRVAVPAPLLALHELTTQVWERNGRAALEEIVRAVRALFQAATVTLHVLSDDGACLVHQAGAGAETGAVLGTGAGAGAVGDVGHVAAGAERPAAFGPLSVEPAMWARPPQTVQPVRLAGPASKHGSPIEDAVRRLADAGGAQTAVGAALIGADGDLMGVLSVLFHDDGRLAPHAELWLEPFAELAARVLERGRLAEAAARDTRRLRASEARLASIIDTAGDGIIVLDAGGRVESANPAAAVLFGRSPADLVGARVDDAVAFTDEGPNGTRRAAISVGPIAVAEVRRADGTTVPVELTTSDWRDADGGVHVTVLVRDVTERRRGEQAQVELRRLEAVAQLAGGVAHDLNNLLTVIGGNLELATERCADEAVRRPLVRATRAVERGGLFSRRLEALAGRAVSEPQRIEPGERVSALAKVVARVMGEHTTVRADLDVAAWSVLAGPEDFDTMVLHLAANARDAMPDGGTLTLRVTNERAAGASEGGPGDHVCVWAVDTGLGMAPELAARAAEPFVTGRQLGAGTGLGLSTVRAFAERHGGFLTIASASGRGTVVKVCLPRLVEDTAPLLSDERPGAPGQRVLLVEDDPDVRSVTAEQLRLLGFEVDAVPSAVAALELLGKGGPIDAVISDVVMPGEMNGIELARWLRRHRPSTGVVLCSGFAQVPPTDDELTGIAILRKPLPGATLAHAVTDAVRRARLAE